MKPATGDAIVESDTIVEGVRVAMFLLNPCVNDSRVQKEAASLAAAGYDVRIYALGNSTYPEGVIDVDGYEVRRLEVRSVYQRSVRGVDRLFKRGVFRVPPLAAAKPEAAAAAPKPATPSNMRAPARQGRTARRVQLIRKRSRRRRVLFEASLKRRQRSAIRSMYLGARRATKIALPIHRSSVRRAFWSKSAAEATAWAPQIVVAHDLNTMTAATRVQKANGSALVYDSHELWIHRNRARPTRRARALDAVVEHRYIRKADLVISVSPSICDWLQKRYRLAERPLLIRNIPVRPAAVAPIDLRKEANVGDGDVVVYTGRITTGRGLETVVPALSQLDNVYLVLLGYGADAYLEELHELAESCGVADRVRHLDPVAPHEVSVTAAQADVGIVAIEPLCLSYRYSLPNKLFEALQAGLPVIASDLPDISALVTHYDAGTLFDVGSPEVATNAIRAALNDKRRLRAGACKASEELTWDSEAALLLAAYAELHRTSRAELN